MSKTSSKEQELSPKSVEFSRVIMAQILQHQDAQLTGIVPGGVVMKHIENAGRIVATRHTLGNCVTSSIDRLDFHNPAFLGDLLILKASLNMVGSTSMEVGVRVEAEDLRTGEVRHTASAYLTFVNLDENCRPKQAPPLLPETKEDRRRNRQAYHRRRFRLAEKTKEKPCISDQTTF